MANSDVAARHLPFPPRQPEGLGKPVRIEITDPRTRPRADREVAYVFHDVTDGTFFVRESATTMTQDQLEQLPVVNRVRPAATRKDGRWSRSVAASLVY